MRKLQLVGTIVALLLVVIGMNTVADMRQQKAKAQAKEVQKAREAAEATAAAAKGKTTEHGSHGGGAPAFTLPPNSGPTTAPVKVESFVNDTNSCHQASTSLKEIQDAYGALVRLEWYSMNDPKVAERSDKLEIGCEAGLVINGKIEMELEKNGGKVLMSFRGPAGDKYKMSDVYRAINQALEAKGKPPPADALAKAQQ